MLYYQEVLYNYTRIKDIEQSNKKDVLFLFVELSISKIQVLGDKKRHQEITVLSEIIRMPFNDAPEVYKDLPLGDYFTEVSKEEFEMLEQLEKDNFVAYASYIREAPLEE